MERIAFKMKLFPDCEEEYRKRHDEIWPELKKNLKEAGISDYSIFLDESTNILFAVLKVKDLDKLNDLPRQAIMKKWWSTLTELMETNADQSPVQAPLKEIFHLD